MIAIKGFGLVSKRIKTSNDRLPISYIYDSFELATKALKDNRMCFTCPEDIEVREFELIIK